MYVSVNSRLCLVYGPRDLLATGWGATPPLSQNQMRQAPDYPQPEEDKQYGIWMDGC